MHIFTDDQCLLFPEEFELLGVSFYLEQKGTSSIK